MNILLASTFTLPDGTQWILAALGALWLLRGMLGKGETTGKVHDEQIGTLKTDLKSHRDETREGFSGLDAKVTKLLSRHDGVFDPSVLRRDLDELRADVDTNTDAIGDIQRTCAAEGITPASPTTTDPHHVKGTTGRHDALPIRPRKVTGGNL